MQDATRVLAPLLIMSALPRWRSLALGDAGDRVPSSASSYTLAASPWWRSSSPPSSQAHSERPYDGGYQLILAKPWKPQRGDRNQVCTR